MKFTPLTIPLSEGLQISADLYVPESPDLPSRSLVILCHGFSGHRRCLFFPAVADAFRNGGHAVLSIDFTGNGADLETGEIVDLESFSTNTFTREEQDLRELLQIIRTSGLPTPSGSMIPEEIFLFGHSRGGVATLMLSDDEQYRDLLKGIVVWASPSDVVPENFGLTKEIAAVWRETGVIPYPVSRLGKEFPLKLVVLEDMESAPYRIEKAVKGSLCPILAVHGEKDESVSMTCAKDIASWSSNARCEIIAGTDHSFGVEKDGQAATPELQQAIDVTLEFLSGNASIA